MSSVGKLRGVVLSALLTLVVACGSGSTPRADGTTSPISPVNTCGPTTLAWSKLAGQSVDAAVAGTGPAVIFANGGGNDVCGWLPLATQLVSSGHRVAVFTYAEATTDADAANLETLLAVASATAQGAKYVLVGASIGGRLVIVAAARRPPGLVGIVSLSGESTLPGARDITPDARRVTLPALYVGARDDTNTDGVTQQNLLHNAMHGNPNELLQRPGHSHGQRLLRGDDGEVVLPRVLAFIKDRLG